MFRINCGLIRSWIFAAGLLLISALGVAGPAQSLASPGEYYLFSVGGANQGLLKSVDGGAISAAVVVEPVGSDGIERKHVGQPKYENLTLEIRFPLPQIVDTWIMDSWAGRSARYDCIVTALDQQLQAKSARQFLKSRITATAIPACDSTNFRASSGYLAVSVVPEAVQSVQGTTPDPSYSFHQIAWLPSKFKLEIDGLDCTKVTRIDPFTVKQEDITDDIGDARDAQKQTGQQVFPNLRITIEASNAQTWQAWFDDFVIAGNNGDSMEKSGTLTFLDANGPAQLLQIKFEHLGIFRLVPTKPDLNEPSDCLIADLYCERMIWIPNGPTARPGDAAAFSGTPGGRSTVGTKNPGQVGSSAGVGGVTPGTRSTLGANNPAPVMGSVPVASLDAALTTPRTMGTDPAFEFALKGLGFTVTRQRVGTDSFAPDAQSKLLLIRYSIHNSSGGAMPVNWSIPALQVTDSNGVNYPARDIGVGPDLVPIGGSISPDQTIDCCAVLAVPGRADATTLTVTAQDAPSQKYPIGGQAQIKETFARDTSAGTSAGFTALAEVPVQAGTFYPMYDLDFRLDGIVYGTRPQGKDEPPAGTQCLIATFTVRNPSPERRHLDSAGLAPVLTLSDGTITKWYGYPLSALRDERTNGDYNPEQEVKMRVFFDVPVSKTVTPASFRFSEGQSRVYTSDVAAFISPG